MCLFLLLDMVNNIKRLMLRTVLFFFLCSMVLTGCSHSGNTIPLTPEEQSWLKEHNNTIRIAPDPYDPPVEFFDENGVYRGISADYIKKFEERFGITFKVVRVADFETVMKLAEQREIDIVTAISESEERKKLFVFTEPYIDDPTVIIVRKETSGYLTTDNLGSMKLTYVKNYALHKELTENYAHLDLAPVEDERTGLRNVSFGIADAMLIDLPSASYFIEKDGLLNLRVAGDEKIYTKYAFAIRSDMPMLAGIIKKGLAGISEKERDAIRSRWIKLDYPSYWLSREFLLMASGSLLAMFAVATGFIIYSRKLKKKARENEQALLAEQMRSKDLEEKLGLVRTYLTDVQEFQNTLQAEAAEHRTAATPDVQDDRRIAGELDSEEEGKNRAKYESTRLSDDTLNVYLNMLMKYMEEKKPYLNQNLSLKTLADEMSIYSHHLSQLLSICLNKNFNNFINDFRIDEVKQMFADPDYDEDTILSIAFQSGFNSKATFNAIFKKATGVTPSQYRENILKQRRLKS